MQAFPAEFSLAGVRGQLDVLTDSEALEKMLALRKCVFDNVQKVLVEQRKGSIVIPLDDVPKPLRIILIKELCERFPGHVAYHRVLVCFDVDQFVMIKDEKNPEAYFEVMVILDDSEVEHIRMFEKK